MNRQVLTSSFDSKAAAEEASARRTAPRSRCRCACDGRRELAAEILPGGEYQSTAFLRTCVDGALHGGSDVRRPGVVDAFILHDARSFDFLRGFLGEDEEFRRVVQPHEVLARFREPETGRAPVDRRLDARGSGG